MDCSSLYTLIESLSLYQRNKCTTCHIDHIPFWKHGLFSPKVMSKGRMCMCIRRGIIVLRRSSAICQGFCNLAIEVYKVCLAPFINHQRITRLGDHIWGRMYWENCGRLRGCKLCRTSNGRRRRCKK